VGIKSAFLLELQNVKILDIAAPYSRRCERALVGGDEVIL